MLPPSAAHAPAPGGGKGLWTPPAYHRTLSPGRWSQSAQHATSSRGRSGSFECVGQNPSGSPLAPCSSSDRTAR
eukprot:9354112-Alexandrium_andersonii.AAC.1